MSFFNEPNKGFDTDDNANEIRQIFHSHWEKVQEKWKEFNETILKWQENLIARINRHAERQLEKLHTDFDEKWCIFKKRRTEAIKRAKVLEENDTKEYKKLRDQCQNLKFYFSNIEAGVKTIDWYRITIVSEQPDLIPKQDYEEDEKSETKSTTESLSEMQPQPTDEGIAEVLEQRRMTRKTRRIRK